MTGASSCVSCGETRASFVCEKPLAVGGRTKVVLDRCAACDLVYQRGWAQTFEAELYDYYALRTEWPIDRVYKAVNARRIEDLLEELGAQVPGRRLLDVGCSFL